MPDPPMVPLISIVRANTMFDLEIGRNPTIGIAEVPAEAVARAMALPAPYFHLPQAILENDGKPPTALVSAMFKNGNKPPTPLVYAMSQVTGLGPDIVFIILNKLSYRDLVLLALTCKSLAFAVVGDDMFKKKAKEEEEAHSKLGHLAIMARFFPNTHFHRSSLMCTYYICPFHMRKARKWAREIKTKMQQLRAERVAKGEIVESPRQLPIETITATTRGTIQLG